ncbi:potassium transporter TrkG [Roseicyclus elongatus]|uniref:potassium transporter TrkG n=1 Tax=Roseicyclus elongatus TaxID=159346 RepID=UPI0004AFCB3F
MLIFVFFLFALSRHTFTSGFGRSFVEKVGRDREIRLALFAVVLLPSLLFLRHWAGAYEVDELSDLGAALRALWGSAFTVLSFLTTTGFVSESWGAAAAWSGLGTPGILLIGLVLMGGGVATTAGGLKLLRVYALYKHGVRELNKLIYPNSVAGAGRMGRRIRREGAYIAWIFFMLFILALAVVMVGLAATGLDFEEAMILSIAALSTTGSLAQVAGETPIAYGALSDAAKLILSAAMIVGRIEMLVLIALLNPAFWRA